MFFLTTYMVKSREQKLRLDIIYLKMFLKKRRNNTNTCCVFFNIKTTCLSLALFDLCV